MVNAKHFILIWCCVECLGQETKTVVCRNNCEICAMESCLNYMTWQGEHSTAKPDRVLFRKQSIFLTTL